MVKRYFAGANDAGQRLDKFLLKAVPTLPPSLLHKAMRKKDIRLNGARCQGGDKLREGDEVRVFLPEAFFAPPAAGHPFLRAPAQVEVVYEDAHLLLVNKPQGLLVHEDAGGNPDTLILRIQHYLYAQGQWDPARENSFAPALCNRIDRNTGGIVLAAKTFEALQVLNEKIRGRQVEKHYLCMLHGTPSPPSGVLKGYHVKDSATNTVRILPHPVPGAKTALTKYRVLAQRGDKCLAEVELLTGRTHQIRAQFAAMGHPLWGDAKYGASRQNAQLNNRQALWAYKVVFAFTTPAGALDYLAGKSFSVPVPFAGQFEGR